MKFNITHKLFFAIFLASGLAVVSSTLIMQWNLSREFLRLINDMEKSGISRMVSRLEEEYRTGGDWEVIRRDPVKWRQLVESSFPELKPRTQDLPPPGSTGDHAPPPGSIPPHIAHQFAQRLFLLDADKTLIIGRQSAAPDAGIIPLHNQVAVIGYLGLHPQKTPDSILHRGFIHRQRYAFASIALMVLILSGVLSLIIATRLVRPLKNITEATHDLAQGRYSVRVPISSSDELGRLASDFNALALAMERNEEARRRWVADISHELRTPLTFLRSQVEAIMDDVREPTSEAVQAIHHEIIRFSRLVDDLYQLSLSDVGALTYRKDEVVVNRILDEVVELLRPAFSAKNIDLVCEGATEKITLFGDAGRLRQLFGNLLDNSLKYTDPGGELRTRIALDNCRLVIDFQDSAPGVPEGELDRLFDRLYRADSSRSRVSGGAGLGLTICRNIVEAHEGIINAKPSPLGGVWIRIELPCCGRG